MEYKFEPLNMKDERIRILCEHNEDTYTLHMGKGMTRQFTNETLPDEVKSLLGLINSFNWDEIHTWFTGDGALSQWIGNRAYDEILWSDRPNYPPVCKEIGWRVGNRYALVVSMKFFNTLRGEGES